MNAYKYEISGTAAQGQTWSDSGSLTTESQGQFLELPLRIAKISFDKLTRHKAVYGKPGVGCVGPYTITKLLIEKTED